MIAYDAHLTIKRIPLSLIQVKEYQPRYPKVFKRYMRLLRKHPDKYAGLLFVVPSDTHPGMFVLLDGHHKFVASIMVGRPDALCVVIETPLRLTIKQQEVSA